MFQTTLIVEPYLNGVQIDSFLSRHFRNYTTWRLQRMVRAGMVKVDGIVAHPFQRVFEREEVEVCLNEPPDHCIPAEALPLEILYEDSWILVINKPPGLITHQVGKFQTGTLTNAVQAHLDEQTSHRGILRPGIVHRLDRMTSGVMVVCKEHWSHRQLSVQFQQRHITKSYLALVAGVMKETESIITLPIGQLPGGNSILVSCRADAKKPKRARTKVKVLRRFSEFTLVQAKPLTGRLHQIRVHLAAVGHPVMGDQYYGTEHMPAKLHPCFESLNVDSEEPRHLLHAWTLELMHPVFENRRTFTAPLPHDFHAILHELHVDN